MSIYNPLPLLKGLWTVLKSVGEKPVTLQYPEQKQPPKDWQDRRNWRNEASENTDEVRYSPGERYASTYEINMMRCIYCGYCEDACPTQAIELGHDYELAYTDKRTSIYTREMLLDPPPENAESTPRKVEPGIFTRSIPDMPDPK